MPRVPLVAGNWKMYKTVPEARDLTTALVRSDLPAAVEVAVCPPFTALAEVGRVLDGSAIRLGAQDMFWEPQGAYTGEISPPMLADLRCHYVIVGHSERRQHFEESDEVVTRKVRAAFSHGLVPILCVGERLGERDAGQTERVVTRQVEIVIAVLPADQISRLVIAYEPIWAIGTGRAATDQEANRVIRLIRETLARKDAEAAVQTRLLYGGSVTPANASEFSRQPEIDGALVGGASLDAPKFLAIVAAHGKSRR
ncbi:MAG: triose-phosphate isomerase [Bacillati bacterium ANGP1]|uniref:Triosephosphate isomerase n=1 Tax=Candidatus Segetimicrobium genomatis TaxID=2569760 RepID=A0A537LID6_9BACT|nr:MAG: triose-phosphate isomerase [Terrabacteria group bacterium ANGP1]